MLSTKRIRARENIAAEEEWAERTAASAGRKCISATRLAIAPCVLPGLSVPSQFRT